MTCFYSPTDTAQAVRFTTELGELEHGIVSAADRILTMELKIFCDLLDRVKSFTDKLIAAAQALAEIDVAAATIS